MIPSVSFEMFLIDTGRADACAIGYWKRWLSEMSSLEEFEFALHSARNEVPVPEYMLDSYYPPSGGTLFIAWLDPEGWKRWCAYARIVHG